MILVYTGILTIIIGITMFCVLLYLGHTRTVTGPKIVNVSNCKDRGNAVEYGSNGPNYVPKYVCDLTTEGESMTNILEGDPLDHIGKNSKISTSIMISKWYWITSYIIMGFGVLQLAIYLLMYLSSPKY
jgi:hypothetical protein